MTSVATPLPDLYPGQHHPVGPKFALALGLVALADWLLYGERPGISLVFFAVALICTSLMANFDGLDRRRAMQAALIFLAGLVPAVEDLNPLTSSSSCERTVGVSSPESVHLVTVVLLNVLPCTEIYELWVRRITSSPA